ncbi:MAG: hypothetical protein DIU77_014720, partial [Thermocrispum agreste]
MTTTPAETVARRTRAGGLLRTAGSRLAHAAAVIFIAYSATFFLLFVLPGDAVLARIGTTDTIGSADVSQLNLDELRDEVGLTDDLGTQYLRGLTGLLHGDLGRSLVTEEPVAGMIADVLPSTVTLAAVSLVPA